ncbi:MULTISPECIES: RNA polymerase sigma factor [Anaeromyxobacter]|uniref:RNA polymerase sigma factor n=1 Tax=Anaeromyxobacter TaxID=161492 RepID=UPI001F58A694|nr:MULTISPECIES: sigma-70 family RNA polymerase sigma factor [unclassified Anaeromyxobacter]
MPDDGDRTRRPAFRVLPGGAARASPGEGAPDDALLAAFLVGDDDAFGDLVRRHERLVLSIVRRYARTPEDARDLAQRTFLRALEAARRTLRRGEREGFAFRRWLVRIAVNLAKNHLRDELRLGRTSLEALGPSEAHPAVAVEALEEAERAAAVRAAVVRLPRRMREVLTLRVDAELPFAEIADTLGISENAARVSFHHATRKLRAALAPEGQP